MTENEAISTLKTDSCYECSQGTDSAVNCEYGACRVAMATRLAIQTLKEVQQYRAIEKELKEQYQANVDIKMIMRYFIETIFKGEKHERFCILTNEDADKWDAYKAFGTVEEIDARFKSGTKTLEQSKKVMEDIMCELEAYQSIGTVEEMQKAVMEEDVLKFYYIESEDKYVVGQRVDNFYYGEVGKTGLVFYMSRYLPWGEHVVDDATAWKEYTYPSEPKEMDFSSWLQGFIKKECGGTIEECREAVEKQRAKNCKQ